MAQGTYLYTISDFLPMIDLILSLDTKALIFMRSLVGQDWARFIQFTGELIVIWCGALLIYLWLSGNKENDEKRKIDALKIFFSIILVFGIYAIINIWLPQFRPNPQEIVWGIGALIPHPIDNSFPSGHSLFSGALIAWVYLFRKSRNILIITIIIALITGISRIVWWVHYPGDVIFGYAIGFIWVLLLKNIIKSSLFEKDIYPFFIKIAKIIRL